MCCTESRRRPARSRSGGWDRDCRKTWNTLDYLIEEGCTYVADWVNDDQPYIMTVGGKSHRFGSVLL